MVLLPIVEREFRCATKRRRTYLVRTFAAVTAVAIGLLTLLNLRTWVASAGVGRTLFGTISSLSFWLCLFAGVFSTAFSLSEERRQGTLGLLFLTHLRGYDVVLGKLAGASLNSVQTLMGILPVLALSFALGGVSAGEFWRMSLVLLNTLFFSLAAGIFSSALSIQPARSSAATVLWIAVWMAPSALTDHFFFRDLRRFGTDYLLPGPFQAFALVWDGRYGLAPFNFWPSVLFTFALGVSLIVLASRITPATCQKKARQLRLWFRQPDLLDAQALELLRQSRRHAFRVNPVSWLEVRHNARWLYLWGLLVLVLGAWLVALACLGFTGGRLSFAMFMCLTPAMHGVLKIAIAAAASNRLSEARRNGELESLLVTPLRTKKICQGHLQALRRQFTLPIAVVLFIDAGLLLFGDAFILETGEQAVVRCLSLWSMMVLLVLDAHALSWLGLWEGLRSKNVFVAMRATLAKVLLVPLPIFGLSMFVAPPVLIFGSTLGAFSGWFLGAVIWWSAISYLVDYFFYSRSSRDLRDHLRTVASEWFTWKQPALGPTISLRPRSSRG